MENKKIITLSVILIFSQIIGLPGIFKIWSAILIGLLVIVLGLRQSHFSKKEPSFSNNQNDSSAKEIGGETFSTEQ